MKLGHAAALVLVALFWGCASEAAHKCNRDLGTSWASSSCIAAVQDPSNQTLVGAIGDEACARAKLGNSDVAVGDAACQQARAKSEKAAWVEIERSASASTQPRLVLDDLLPGLPKAPSQPAIVSPDALQLLVEQHKLLVEHYKRKLLERQIRKQQRQLKQQAELRVRGLSPDLWRHSFQDAEIARSRGVIRLHSGTGDRRLPVVRAPDMVRFSVGK